MKKNVVKTLMCGLSETNVPVVIRASKSWSKSPRESISVDSREPVKSDMKTDARKDGVP